MRIVQVIRKWDAPPEGEYVRISFSRDLKSGKLDVVTLDREQAICLLKQLAKAI